jgi:hypothetical protein
MSSTYQIVEVENDWRPGTTFFAVVRDDGRFMGQHATRREATQQLQSLTKRRQA